MSLPNGSLSTSGGVSAARSAGVCTPIQRAVCTEPSWLTNDTQALLGCTFCGTPRFGTTMTPRCGSYEQLSAEKIEPKTFTFGEMGAKVPPVAGTTGIPSGLPTE